MKPRNRSWAVDLPGLTEDEADLVVEFARSLPGVIGASTTDPKFMMTIGMDRYGVETIARALRGQSATEADALAMLEIFDEWLEYADQAQTWD